MDQLWTDFEVPELQAWRDEVNRLLKGAPFEERMTSRTPEGLTLQPLYTSGDQDPADPGLPGEPPFIRGYRQHQPDEIPWKIVQEQLPLLNGDDPLGIIAREGGDLTPELWENLAHHLHNHDSATGLAIDVGVYADGGANGVQQLAFLLATGVEYLRRLEAEGIPVEQAAPDFIAGFAIGSDFFMEMAKLRAARLLWHRVLELAGLPPRKRGLQIRARTGRLNKTRFSAHTNILRTTTETFAAVAGGANTIEVAGFDQSAADPGELGRRIARNIQIILRDEAGLGLVQDPGGGSWYLEKLTSELAEAAWKLFQEIETMGGMSTCLASGFVHDWISAVADLRLRLAGTGRSVLVGTNRYPEPNTDGKATHQSGERATEGQSPPPTRETASISAETEIPPIPVRPLGEPFEKLRLAVEKHGANKDPLKISLATFGPVGHYTPRLDFITSFFEIGGFRVVRNDLTGAPDEIAAATLASGPSAVALVGLDETWQGDHLPAVARLIAESQPDLKIYLAGLPQDDRLRKTLTEAGVSEFIHFRSDMLQQLGRLAVTVGVKL
jgi:methylmalonyl-CoA mutase